MAPIPPSTINLTWLFAATNADICAAGAPDATNKEMTTLAAKVIVETTAA